VHRAVQERLLADPDRVVVEHAGATITAAEFDRRADRVATWLVRSGLTTGRAVGLRMHRSIDVLVAIHGVLRAGGVFVMLAPDDPAVRHDLIAADADLFTILDALPAEAFGGRDTPATTRRRSPTSTSIRAPTSSTPPDRPARPRVCRSRIVDSPTISRSPSRPTPTTSHRSWRCIRRWCSISRSPACSSRTSPVAGSWCSTRNRSPRSARSPPTTGSRS
jgi:acyl-CoA synthetase (AMP-forming)/AMP-acid ligase II